MSNDSGNDQLSILVIDDEPHVTSMIAEALLKHGHMVVTAISAEEGLEQLPYHTFQVAFLDHHLPRMEGFVLAGYLRQNNPHMQIALITGETDPKLRDDVERLGLTFIQKPFDIPQLVEVIDRYLQLANERSERRASEGDPEFAPRFVDHFRDLAEAYELPGVPGRIAEHLGRRIKEHLNGLSSAARYSERERVAALAGLLTARVLGVSLPKRRDGSTLYEYYDKIMTENGRRSEFSE